MRPLNRPTLPLAIEPEAATKLIYLAIRNVEKDDRNVRAWFAARNRFATMSGERVNA